MAFGDDLVALAKAHIGERYRLGARARFLDPDFKGPWDCAEFISWVIYQASGGRTLLGCKPRDAARAEAYTGFWVDDAKKYGLIVSIDNALRTVGAALLRAPAKKRIGHIAFSLGDGRGTVEAHSAKYGVIRGNADPKKRGWEYGVRIPAPAQWKTLTAEASDPDAWFFRPTFAPTVDPRVEAIQTALDKKGFDTPVSGHYTEALASTVADFQEAKKLVVDGMVGKQTLKALRLDWSSNKAPSGVYNDRYGVFFDTLTSGGFFSHDPDDLGVKRSIRTNNPGALNFSAWQKSLPGYVAVTPPDNSPDRNRTTIYRTPEHGVAAWFILLSDRYGFGKRGQFTLAQLARKYAGSNAPQKAVDTYVRGWSKASGGKFDAATTFRPSSVADMLALGRAMFLHEIGKPSPLQDAQIRYGIQNSDNMPA